MLAPQDPHPSSIVTVTGAHPVDVDTLIGDDAPEVIDEHERRVLLEHLLMRPAEHDRRYLGALHLLVRFNEGALLGTREVRTHMYRAGAPVHVSFLRLGLALSLDGRHLGLLGSTAARTVGLCTALACDHTNSDLGSILAKFDAANAGVAVAAVAIVCGVMPADGVADMRA